MTGNEIYKKALAFLMEKPNEDRAFLDSALSLINAGLADILQVENSIRTYEGRAEIPDLEIETLEEKVPANRGILKLLPLYLASHFFRDDLDDKNSELFYNRYVEGKKRLMRARFITIEDAYGGDADEN